MSLDQMLVEATKAKLHEAITILESANFSKGHILKIIETANREVVEEIKRDMWHEASNIPYK